MTSSAEFSGIICPSITITKDDGDIDYERWGQHLDHLIEAGINGVLVFGSIGEFYAFPLDVKKQAVDFVAKHVAGRGQGGSLDDVVQGACVGEYLLSHGVQ